MITEPKKLPLWVLCCRRGGAIDHWQAQRLQGRLAETKLLINRQLMAGGVRDAGRQNLGDDPRAPIALADAAPAMTHGMIDARVAQYEAEYASGNYNSFARADYLQSAADRHGYVSLLDSMAMAQLAEDGAFVGRSWLTTASIVTGGGFGLAAGAADIGIGIYNGEISAHDLVTGGLVTVGLGLATHGLSKAFTAARAGGVAEGVPTIADNVFVRFDPMAVDSSINATGIRCKRHH